ncbi:MAG: sugar ABC transporter permease [Oscillospiraceae bacterium]|nr:sugar ABC transporter permease [Oscillospiraceae bacterium]
MSEAITAAKDAVVKKRLSPHKRNSWMWGYFFIAPMSLGVLLFAIGPTIFAFYMSLTDWDGLRAQPSFIGFENFINLANDHVVIQEFRNTIVYSLSVVPATIAIAIVLAVFLNSKIPARTFFRVIYFLPIVTMPVAVATVWRYLLHSELGLVNVILRPFGLNPQWLADPNWIMPAVVIVAIWGGLAFAIIILLAGLQSISTTYYEAADIDGATAWSKFYYITLPLLSPSIFFLFVTSFIGAFRVFDIIYIISGATQIARGPVDFAVRSVVYGIFERGFFFNQMGYAAAQAVVLFFFILVFTGFQFFMQKKVVFYN